MHLDSFQRILVDPASVSIVAYTDSRPYVITTNSTNADLGKLLAPPPKKKSRAKNAPPRSDAAVGGGLGASDQLTP
jgi:2,3-bisphosphoglycerate-dependent phosphoglycerate mutase